MSLLLSKQLQLLCSTQASRISPLQMALAWQHPRPTWSWHLSPASLRLISSTSSPLWKKLQVKLTFHWLITPMENYRHSQLPPSYSLDRLNCTWRTYVAWCLYIASWKLCLASKKIPSNAQSSSIACQTLMQSGHSVLSSVLSTSRLRSVASDI